VARVQPRAATTAQEAAQEQHALAQARAHTQARLTQVLAALPPTQRQALDERAKTRVALRETDFGYSVTLQFAREDLLLQESLGFDCWPRLVEQLRVRDAVADGDNILQTCRLEAILDGGLVVSVPTAAAKAQLTAHYLGLLEDLASTPAQRIQIQVLIR